jgi:hypothetical protein
MTQEEKYIITLHTLGKLVALHDRDGMANWGEWNDALKQARAILEDAKHV